MVLNYFQKVMFSFLEVISGILNLVTSLLGGSPTWDLDGTYLKTRFDSVYFKQVSRTSQSRETAKQEYDARVEEIKSKSI